MPANSLHRSSTDGGIDEVDRRPGHAAPNSRTTTLLRVRRTARFRPFRPRNDEQLGQLDLQPVGDSHERVERDVGTPLFDASVVRREHSELVGEGLLRLSIRLSKLLNSESKAPSRLLRPR
jgi:hypothetical protein